MVTVIFPVELSQAMLAIPVFRVMVRSSVCVSMTVTELLIPLHTVVASTVPPLAAMFSETVVFMLSANARPSEIRARTV